MKAERSSVKLQYYTVKYHSGEVKPRRPILLALRAIFLVQFSWLHSPRQIPTWLCWALLFNPQEQTARGIEKPESWREGHREKLRVVEKGREGS